MTMSTMTLVPSRPHAGQRRYHDYPKLRAIHQSRSALSLTGRGPFVFLTSPNFHHASATLHQLQAGRCFFWGNASSSGGSGNPVAQAMRDMQLKRLERQANQAPDDAGAQYRFLSELAVDYPEALIARMKHAAFRNCAVSPESALLYLQTLQKMQQTSHLDVDDLIQRISRSQSLSMHPSHSRSSTYIPSMLPPIPPERWSEWRRELADQKLNKADQAQQFIHFLMTGGATAAGAAGTSASTALASSAAAPLAWNAGAGRGMDPRHPLHVQISQPGMGIRGAILGFVGRAALLFVAFSALGALLDERGLGRGMGMNAGSKHIQEAEANGRKVKFEDVKGVEEAKAELEEIVMYLKDPSRFTRLGGKLSKGLLLTGPPGTGKTLLAKAIAGEADVPFFFSSGSQFEEVYVGLGAKRIRELFEAAKKKAPAIIFIDEIDAVGGTRRLKDQSALKMTLNELLVQLDGFEENNGIIVIGATNFMESLDPALLRPGRFDKHVTVPLPDVGGRKEILEMYAKKTKMAKDVDLGVLARGTTGFSGADLYNLMNQAALKASVDGLNSITMSVLEYAKDKILMGAERRTAVITPETARCTAYHEAGHAVVAVLTEGAMPIHKATIMPRGNALGMVTMLPEGDQTSQSFKEMLALMDVNMGGRVAEELVFGKDEITSGASSDIQTASRVARNMVTKFGFSDEVGVVFHGGSNGEESASAETRARIDAEVKKLTDAAYKRAKDLLTKHAREHRLLAETLLEYETLTGDEVRDLVKKRIKPKRPILTSAQRSNKNGTAVGSSTSQSGGTRLSGIKSQESQ